FCSQTAATTPTTSARPWRCATWCRSSPCAKPGSYGSPLTAGSTACAISLSGASTSSRMPVASPPATTRPPKASWASSTSRRSASGSAICQHDLIYRRRDDPDGDGRFVAIVAPGIVGLAELEAVAGLQLDLAVAYDQGQATRD